MPSKPTPSVRGSAPKQPQQPLQPKKTQATLPFGAGKPALARAQPAAAAAAHPTPAPPAATAPGSAPPPVSDHEGQILSSVFNDISGKSNKWHHV